MRRSRALAAVALAVGALAAACGGSDEAAAPTAAQPPTAESEPATGAPSAGAPIPGGGLSIPEAIDSTLEGALMVKGFIVADGEDSVRLCAALAESYPPQCGEPSLALVGLDLETVEGLVRDETDPGRAWTETEISVLGEIENGSIAVSETSI